MLSSGKEDSSCQQSTPIDGDGGTFWLCLDCMKAWTSPSKRACHLLV